VALGQRTKSAPEGTAHRILEHARHAFNERGVTAVGIREIARDLNLSPGNVSYHFATKEDLVLALIEEMHGENNAVFAPNDGPHDFVQLDASIRAVMRRDLDNRWLMRDAVGLLIVLPALRPLQKRMHRARLVRVDAIVERLTGAKLLDARKIEGRLTILRQQIVTQLFFWIPSAIVAAPDRDPAASLDDHARAVLALFSDFCTPLGRRQLEGLLAT
jgi:AcrR family transcriptional regulator